MLKYFLLVPLASLMNPNKNQPHKGRLPKINQAFYFEAHGRVGIIKPGSSLRSYVSAFDACNQSSENLCGTNSLPVTVSQHVCLLPCTRSKYASWIWVVSRSKDRREQPVFHYCRNRTESSGRHWNCQENDQDDKGKSSFTLINIDMNWIMVVNLQIKKQNGGEKTFK